MIKPDDGYIAYITNPKAGASSRKLSGQYFRDYLIKRKFELRVDYTTSLENACELAAHAAGDSRCSMVVVLGGDGTVREVAQGMKGSDKPLMIVPGGTENLLANELGFNEKVKTIITAFEAGYTRQLDLGKVNGKCFTSILGFGFDGEIVKLVSSRRNGHITHFAYFQPIWRTFWTHKFPRMKVDVDGSEIFNGTGMVFVGNISRYAVGFQILHNANFSDGLLDICIYKCSSKIHLVKHSLMTVLKRHTFGSDVIYCQGKNITVSSEVKNTPTEIDGDPGPALPADIKIIPHAVKVIAPEGAKPAGIRTRIIRALT